MFVTFDTFQPVTFPLKEAHAANIFDMFVTLETSQVLTPPVKRTHRENMPVRFVIFFGRVPGQRMNVLLIPTDDNWRFARGKLSQLRILVIRDV